MKSRIPSLEYLLPLLYDAPLGFIATEISALKKVIAVILQEVHHKENLEQKLLSSLESREMHLRSKLMNVKPSYTMNRLEHIIALEHELGQMAIQKVKTQEQSAHDIIELRKLLWHYWLLLHKKEAQRYFLR